MRININDFGHDLYEFTKKSHRDMSEESIRTQLKDLFIKHGIDDSNFALISVAISGNGVSAEAKNTTTYINKISKKLFEKEERIKYKEKFGKEPERPEDVKKTKQDKPFINLDVHKLSKLTSRIDIESYITRQLADQNRDGLNFSEFRNKTVTYYTQNEFNMPISLSEIEGKPLVSGLADSIISKQSSSEQNKNTQLSDEQKAEKDKKILNNEEKFNISEIGEGTGDINYFVGYDKEKVGKLFEGREDLFKAFKEFVEYYNNLMNKLLNQDLESKTVNKIQNNIDPQFNKMVAVCSQYGGDGAQVINLCKGMMTIYNRVCESEKEGKNIDGLKLKLHMESTKVFEQTNNDGLRHEHPNENSTTPSSIDKIIDKLTDNEDALTDEDEKEIVDFGIEGIITHSAMEEFRRSDEYELLQNIQSIALGRNDTNPPV